MFPASNCLGQEESSGPGRAGPGGAGDLCRKAALVVAVRVPGSIGVVLPLCFSLPIGSMGTSQFNVLVFR